MSLMRTLSMGQVASGNHLTADCDEETRLRLVHQEDADFKTRAARAEIKKLAAHMTAPQAISLLSSLVSAFEASLELRTSVTARNALDDLLGAIGVLEDGEAA